MLGIALFSIYIYRERDIYIYTYTYTYTFVEVTVNMQVKLKSILKRRFVKQVSWNKSRCRLNEEHLHVIKISSCSKALSNMKAEIED